MTPLAKSATIGIIGGGQLGQMLADAARELGYKTHIFVPEENSPASQRADVTTVAKYNDEAALAAFADAVDVVTFEFENIPPASLRFLDEHITVYPSPSILDICRNRIVEKDTLNKIGAQTAPYAAIRGADDLYPAMDAIGTPSVMKTAEMGYDGKGQIKLDGSLNIGDVWLKLNAAECVLEGWVPFEYEISVIVARDQAGGIACYDPVHNIHKDHILHKTIAPAPDAGDVNARAIETAKQIAEKLDLVGIMAVEMFVEPDGTIRVNEMAPRPHNSGHWTIEGAATSQFAQLIGIAAGLPVADTSTKTPCEMVNLIGDDVNDLSAYEANAQAHIHLYGKAEARAGRKMGHVTIVQG